MSSNFVQEDLPALLSIINLKCNLVIIIANESETNLKEKEEAILKAAEIMRRNNQTQSLATLIRSLSSFWQEAPKAKTAKIIKHLIDSFKGLPDSLAVQIELSKELIDWCQKDNRIFLKQALETRLVAIYLENQMFQEALSLIAVLLKELKKMDDKMALLEIQLLESKVYFAIKNLAKSKAALTSARSSGNSIYCPPLVQASLDMQSGILHAEERDFKTAFSYFFETLDAYSSQNDILAVTALKYMLLCKIMLNEPDDLFNIVSGKLGSKYSKEPEILALQEVATSLKNRSLSEFDSNLKKYSSVLFRDEIMKRHLSSLYDTLLEQNLIRIIEPFHKVEISHLSHLMQINEAAIETKLSKMILDKTLNGILDQGAGCLIVYEDQKEDQTYITAVSFVKQMGLAVDSLYQKAAKLT